MSSGLTSALSEFTKRSEFAKSPLADASSDEPPRVRAKLNLMRWMPARLDKLVSSAFARYLLAVFVGVAVTLAWQSYGGAARKTIAGWSPRLAWLAPAAVPGGISPDRVKATSLALTAVHESVDKLATEIGKLETQGGSGETSTPPPSRRSARRL